MTDPQRFQPVPPPQTFAPGPQQTPVTPDGSPPGGHAAQTRAPYIPAAPATPARQPSSALAMSRATTIGLVVAALIVLVALIAIASF